jgi:hypothetical protein
MGDVLLLLAGSLVTLIVTHIYYRKSSTSVPEWAKPVLENLPASPPTPDELLRLFQEALDSGEATPDPVLGHVACPDCGTPSTQFRHTTHTDDRLTVVVAECPTCGWTDHTQI